MQGARADAHTRLADTRPGPDGAEGVAAAATVAGPVAELLGVTVPGVPAASAGADGRTPPAGTGSKAALDQFGRLGPSVPPGCAL